MSHQPQRREREEEQQQDDNTTTTTSQTDQQQQQPKPENQAARKNDFMNERYKNGCGLTLFEALYEYHNNNSSTSNHTDAATSQVQRPPPRFYGLLKERYSDFIVRERAPTPLVLKSMEVPDDCKNPDLPKEEEFKFPTEEKIVEVLGPVLGGEDSEDLKVLLKSIPDFATLERIELPTKRTEKLTRAKIHQAIKQCGFFESGTGKDDQLFIIPGPGCSGGDSRGPSGGKQNNNKKKGQYGGRQGGQPQYQQHHALINRALWPAGRGEHLHFTLYKENLESSAALRQIAAKLGIPLRMIQYCGNKDKRAVTTQRVSCRFLSAESVAKLNGMSYGKSSLVRLGDFEYKTEPLQLGKLLGNGFTIALRRVNDTEGFGEDLAKNHQVNEESLKLFEKSVQENGFANYFGPQRFGTTGIPSYEIGKALLRCDYAKALQLCFESKAQIAPDFIPALKAYRDENDIAKALKLAPYHCTFERDALVALNSSKATSKNDIQRAILALPRPLTMLYCHSVQSLVFNTMLARRLRVAPVVLEGDMVLQNNNAASSLLASGGADDNEDLETQQQHQQADTTTTAADASSTNNTSTSQHLPPVHFVTKEDIENNTYSLADVILPIPGNDPDLQYAQNEISGKEAYIKCMHEELGIGDGLLKANEFTEKRFHIHGAYRQIVVKPENFTVKLTTYSNNNELLVETDYQKLAKNDKAEFRPNQLFVANNADGAEQKMTEQPKKFAVVTSFELPAGAYATSVLREMCATVSDSRQLEK